MPNAEQGIPKAELKPRKNGSGVCWLSCFNQATGLASAVRIR